MKRTHDMTRTDASEALERFLSSNAPKETQVMEERDVFLALPVRALVPTDRDADKQDPSLARFKGEPRMKYDIAMQRIDELSMNRTSFDDKNTPIRVSEHHEHRYVDVPPECKALCLHMAMDDLARHTWKRTSRETRPEDEVNVKSLFPKNVSTDNEDYVTSHALLKRRGCITMRQKAKYNWFENFIAPIRIDMDDDISYDCTLGSFLETVENGSRILCKTIELDAARGRMYVCLGIDAGDAFFVCVAFLLRAPEIPEKLLQRNGSVLLETVERIESATAIKLRYIGHAYFACPCEEVQSKLD